MSTILLAVSTTIAILTGIAAPAAAQDDNERDYLTDLREVNVFVDDLAPDAEAVGLTRDGIEAAVEARLRERRVPLGRSQLAGDLYVRVATHRGTTGLYAYFARVSLQQLVTIEGNQERAFVDTWDLDSLGTVGEANLPQVQRVVLQIVDVFIDDYFSGRVDDWRGGGRRMGVAVSGGFRNAGASLPAVAPFPVAAHRTGRAVFPHPALGRDHAFAHGKLVVRGPRCVSP